MPNQHSSVAQYFKSKKMIKSFDKKKRKLLKEVRRDQKKITKIGQKVDDRKRKIAALEMEIRLMNLELEEVKDEKKTASSVRASHGSWRVSPLKSDEEMCISFNPDGSLQTIREECEGQEIGTCEKN